MERVDGKTQENLNRSRRDWVLVILVGDSGREGCSAGPGAWLNPLDYMTNTHSVLHPRAW